MKQKRIEWICDLLKVPSSLVEIIDFVSKNAHKQGFLKKNKTYSKRTIEGDINTIRQGKFIFSNSIKRKEKRRFKLPYDRAKNVYYFDKDCAIPEFDKITIEENLTFPFIEGILAPYKEIPGVKKVIEKIKEFYPFEFGSNKFNQAVVTTNYQDGNEIVLRTINKSTELLKYINNDRIISFDYINVNNTTRSFKDTITLKVIPLQVRIHEELYYLIAYDIETKKISTFRVDQIKSKIEKKTTKLAETEIELIKNNFNENYFKFSFGIWRPKSDDVYTLKIKFTEWAAQYVIAKPIHKTQKISLNSSDNGVTIAIQLLLEKMPYKPYDLENISKELAFSLSRFRNNYEIISIDKNEFSEI